MYNICMYITSYQKFKQCKWDLNSHLRVAVAPFSIELSQGEFTNIQLVHSIIFAVPVSIY